MERMLICDCGGSKGSWAAVDELGNVRNAETRGINAMQSPQEIIEDVILRELPVALPEARDAERVYFYGAGCIDDKAKEAVAEPLRRLCSKAAVEVETDLLGAARALCGREAGVACILGTGSNSCLYDGRGIVANVPPLGYILGDEGSGAVLGRKLIADLLKGLLPPELKQEFFAYCGLDYSGIIRRVYREPGANAFMASATPFIKEHIGAPGINQLVVDAFRDFFERNVKQYATSAPASFVGSIAYHFELQLRQAAELSGAQIGVIVQTPLPRLIDYHIAQDNQ